MMRICLLTPEFPPYRVGGIGAYVATLAAGLGGRGHAVDVVGCDIHPKPGTLVHPWGRSISLPAGEHLLNRPCARAVDRALRWLAHRQAPAVWRVYPYLPHRQLLARALVIRRFVRRTAHRYDVIELSNWMGEAAFVPRRRGRYVARLSTSVVDTHPGGSWVPLAMERRAVGRADAVAAHSDAMLRKGVEIYGFPPARGVVIPLGIPDRPLPPGPANDGKLVLVSLGRAEDRKGTDLLLAALAQVMPDFPELTYRFIGPGLNEYLAARPDLRAIWERLHAAGRVTDLGGVSEEEKERALGAAHWLVTPSRFESFGLMVAEALRAGTPAVYAHVGGLAEVGPKGPENVAVRPDDAADLERGLREVCRRGVAFVLAARPAARAAYERHFRDDAMIDRTLEVYRAVVQRRKRSGVSGGEP